jgi:hypothetical protein
MKITALDESADFATLDTEKLFNKLKYHELSRKGHPNHDVSFSSKALITGARVGGHVCHTRFLRPKPDAHRMYAQDQVVIHTVRM